MLLGRHYTPAPLAREVVRRTLAPLSGRGPLRILDPACGEGVFLEEALRLLGPGHELVGVDLDGAALERANPLFDLRHDDALRMDWGGERFDAVIGNPPWVSFSGRHARPLRNEDKHFLAERYETFAGWPSLHAPFVELAVRLSTGRVGLLLPGQVRELAGYGPLRAFVRRNCTVLECPEYGEDAFEGVTQPCCALILERGASTGGAEPFGGAPDPLAHCPRPSPTAFADIGVHTGNCAGKLLGDAGVPIREGKDVEAFRLRPPRLFLRDDRPRGAREYYRIGPLERYERVPILLRQTALRPIASLHTEPTYFRNSVIACMGIEGVPHEKVVAWLNSEVIAEYHRLMNREANQRAFPQLKLRHLRDLPMPDWEAVREGEEISLEAFGLEGRDVEWRELTAVS